VFELSFFRNNPYPFYTLAHELYPGNFRPTISHSFIRLLHQKGLLLKLFTQNIDCLEREAGLPGHMIVEAHGSFATQSCIECKAAYPEDLMKEAIKNKSVPHCLNSICNGLVKPDVVFFGEQLPHEFFANRELPAVADLCIIMGTSLSVHPFAALPQFCADGVPRVLINQEQVGGIGSRTDDVLILGDCDAGVRKLAEALGWLEELEELWAETAPKDAGKKEEPKKSRDEQLENEVDKLTKEVEESLRLSENQHKWLEGHLDKKVAKIQENEEKGTLPETATAETEEEPKTESSKTVSEFKSESKAEDKTEPAKKDPDGGSLGHVFPFEDKKPSL
jgi:NAD-dependent histone deacetylase SIR2